MTNVASHLISDGIVPVMLLLDRSRLMSDPRRDSSDPDSGPDSMLLRRLSSVRYTRLPMAAGTVPVNLRGGGLGAPHHHRLSSKRRDARERRSGS